MKRLIALALIVALPLLALATEYSVVFIEAAIADASKVLIMENVQEIGSDSNLIDWETMPKWRLKADTNMIGYIVCIRTDTHGVHDWKEMPLPQVETRVTKDVPPPDKQRTHVLSRADLFDEYEPVPVVVGP